MCKKKGKEKIDILLDKGEEVGGKCHFKEEIKEKGITESRRLCKEKC